MKPVILNIDTATEDAGVCITVGGEAIATELNSDQKDHASWVQVALKNLLEKSAYAMKDLHAVAVTSGPGSYTGLRVGMATAKGICYALKIPLITVNTLEAMAYSVREFYGNSVANSLLCPMIDARRMEVFTAMYDYDLDTVIEPVALVLDAETFKEQLNKKHVVFFGSGSAKWKPLCNHSNAIFGPFKILKISHLGNMATSLYLKGIFADLAYENPVYLKEFYSYTKK
jgi:tRNA threonylcarbamoyladenosine biosynthesis protein TsaB